MNLPEFLTEWPYGEIVLTGHRIGLFTVVRDYREGSAVEEIAEEYPTLSLDLVRKVISFYKKNRAEVDAYVDNYQAELDRQYAAYVPGPGALRIRRLWEMVQKADAERAGDPEWAALSIVEKALRLEQESTSKPS